VLCSLKKNTHPTLCAEHHVPLVESQIAIDPYAPGLGSIKCLRCPVSLHVVVQDEKKSWKQLSN
jgi:hypothetical protein